MAPSRDDDAATPSTCVVPRRFSYYFAGGHERHHLHVGTPRDADADALFWLWERQPVHEADIYTSRNRSRLRVAVADSIVGGVLWASTVALLLPIAYAYALLRCLVRDWAANWRETFFWLSESYASYLVMRTLCILKPWLRGRPLPSVIVSVQCGLPLPPVHRLLAHAARLCYRLG